MYPDSQTTISNSSMIYGVLAMFIFALTIFVIAYVLNSFLLSRIFKKAGVSQGIAWVPIYNTWKMMELGDQKGFWAILMIIPYVNFVSLVFMYIAMFHIARKLGKDDWYIVLAIFLPIVWYIILGFDSSKWNDGNNIVAAVNNSQPAYAPPMPVVNGQITSSTQPVPQTSPTAYNPQPEIFNPANQPENSPQPIASDNNRQQ